MPKAPLRRRTDPPPAGEADLLRALVVDDHEPYREYIAELVSRFGFQVTAAGDGTTALAVLREHAPFHLLIVDCEMPRMSGLALIAAVRAQERFSDVYAVMLTAREDVGTKVSALRLGFDDYISKSASEVEIAAKLSAARRLVSRQHRLHETVRELYGLATHDELTGVFNRRLFFAEAERLLAEGTAVGLIFFDLDDFKRVNDTFGHLAGDRLLRDIGSLFLSRTRHEDLIARYGGDEFVMLVLGLAPPEVEVLARRMADQIASARWTFGTETFSLGVTTGVACSSQLQQPTLPQLLSAGDRDLYRNKWLRKNPGVDPALYIYDAAREGRLTGE
ncbi:MAG TPA: diguanylate cyclase [Thermoanaerobaculia bacterium]|nr:diguanylate cyclase [Thermoanaerobaculia bacterium]